MTAVIRDYHLSAMEAAAVVVVADALGVNADFVIRTGRSTHQPPSVYGPALIYAHECHRSFEDVWRDRDRDDERGWGNVAHRIGMNPGTFNKYRKQGYSVDEIIWMDAMHDRYKVSYDRYDGWRRDGYSNRMILENAGRYNGNYKKMDSHWKGERERDKQGGNSQGRGNSDHGDRGRGNSNKGGGHGNSGHGHGH